MLVETRRKQLIDLISQRGFATLEELTGKLGVSESTIRRDLEALDVAGAVKRTHGGAVYTGEVRSMPALDDRAASAIEEKRAIGQLAASLIAEGETVLLDGGTTTLEIARALAGRHVQVVTNSLPIAHLLAPDKDVDLILIGGYVYPRTGVALGPIAIACMETIRVQRVFLGAHGVVADGIYNSNSLLVETERQMMRCGQEIYLAVDHTKFGKRALTRLCALSDIHGVIVDDQLDPADGEMVVNAKARLLLAPVAADRPPAGLRETAPAALDASTSTLIPQATSIEPSRSRA